MIGVNRLGQGDLAGFRAISAIFSEVFGEPENYAAHPPGDAYAEGWLANPDHVAVLGHVGGQPAGSLARYILRKFEHELAEAYMYDLAVDPAYRRIGWPPR